MVMMMFVNDDEKTAPSGMGTYVKRNRGWLSLRCLSSASSWRQLREHLVILAMMTVMVMIKRMMMVL